jgi:hypothetical protein
MSSSRQLCACVCKRERERCISKRLHNPLKRGRAKSCAGATKDRHVREPCCVDKGGACAVRQNLNKAFCLGTTTRLYDDRRQGGQGLGREQKCTYLLLSAPIVTRNESNTSVLHTGSDPSYCIIKRAIRSSGDDVTRQRVVRA